MFHYGNINSSVSLSQFIQTIKRAAFVALFIAPSVATACYQVTGWVPGGNDLVCYSGPTPVYTTSAKVLETCGVYQPTADTSADAMLAAVSACNGQTFTCNSVENSYTAYIYKTSSTTVGVKVGTTFWSTATPVTQQVECAPACTAGSTLMQDFASYPPDVYCDGSCAWTKSGDTLCVKLGSDPVQVCGTTYSSTAEVCTTQTDTGPVPPSTCGTIDGIEVCGNTDATAATENCFMVGGQQYCDGTVSYGDCTSTDGSMVCNSTPSAIDGTVTSSVPKDPTTGNALDASASVTRDNADGTTSTMSLYSSTLIAANSPYACDNPDTAVWEPCPGYCDNPSTVQNECLSYASTCEDDPNTLYDESQLCSSWQSTDCGGFMQPPCNSSYQPVTTDTTTPGTVITADGIKMTDAVNALGDKLTTGWSQPVLNGNAVVDTAGALNEIDLAKQNYATAIAQIQSEASAFFSLSTQAGTLPCWENLQLGFTSGTYRLCPRDYESSLNVIGMIILAMAAVIAFIVLLR